MAESVAILLDGGFVKKRLKIRLGRFPQRQEIVSLSSDLMKHPRLAGKELFRVFFYDAPPFEGHSKNPLDGIDVDFGSTPAAKQNKSLLDSLELEPDFAVRRGELATRGWKLGDRALKNLYARGQRPIAPNDLVPDMEQKGVDLRIGLDIATIALKRVVSILVLVTGDSDLIPAMKFARTEGLRVYVDAMGNPIRRELKAHADFVF